MDKYLITPDEIDDLTNRFTYHGPHGNQPERYESLRNGGFSFAERIIELAPPSPERTLAIRRIEEAVMWANAAIARNEKPPETTELQR